MKITTIDLDIAKQAIGVLSAQGENFSHSHRGNWQSFEDEHEDDEDVAPDADDPALNLCIPGSS